MDEPISPCTSKGKLCVLGCVKPDNSGTGKEKTTITREEYEGLNDQIRRMREVLKLTVQVMDREELVDGRLHIENKMVRARAKAELSQSQSDPVSTKEGGNE